MSKEELIIKMLKVNGDMWEYQTEINDSTAISIILMGVVLIILLTWVYILSRRLKKLEALNNEN